MLSHVDKNGKAKMVDVSQKKRTFRKAYAKGSIFVGGKILNLIKDNEIKKGDVLSTAKIAGIIAAKKTGELIPLCHPLNLTFIDIYFQYDDLNEGILIFSSASINAPTGVEMEALIAVNVAALTIYDMCKGVDKAIVLGENFLLKKTGGKSGLFRNIEKIKGYVSQDIIIKGELDFKHLGVIGFIPEVLEYNDTLKTEKGNIKVNLLGQDEIYIYSEEKIELKRGDNIWIA